MLLASFANPKRNDTACDFGSGCGIIPFLWLRDGKCKEITAIEIQNNGCNQMRRSTELNNTEKIIILNRDLKEIDDLKKDIASKEIAVEADKYAFEMKLLNGLGEEMMNELSNPKKESIWLKWKYKFARWKQIRKDKKILKKGGF
jgi:tRNA G37 N-methylase Trm5